MPPTSPPPTAAQLAAWLSRRLEEAQTLLGSHDGFDRYRWLSGLVPNNTFAALQARLEAETGPAEVALAPAREESSLRAAVINATRPNLVRQVAVGVSVYLTGNMRRSALPGNGRGHFGAGALAHRGIGPAATGAGAAGGVFRVKGAGV